MSLNTAHLNGGVLIHNGEQILLYSDGVAVEWSAQQSGAFQGTKKGLIYLTTHRVIFINKSGGDEMLSFSFPFVTLSEVEVEQPVFGANYIKGKVRAQPNGNWIGEAKFKITFKKGGAIEFGESMLRAAHFASRGGMQAPPPYVPPQNQWYAAPPPAYAPPPQDAKAAEAAQSAYYDPNQPQMAFIPPPAYYENPPSYNQATGKKTQ
ncbi:unnamed protein product [Psylliodes chrysocephalus]|uniref:GRAM domain-containing protein n=1 Tax=Psylliodes chrysocephalus TaxID=3402493 RepID=A0A9P0CZ96_9CUCU|nr:unnamed protein product [Psylliodes chrysocephala]